jgi:hypothetical protein
MLVGMTVPPGGYGDDQATERRVHRVASAGQRSAEAGDGGDGVAEQAQEAEARSPQAYPNGDADSSADTAHDPAPEHMRRAALLEERSYRRAQRERKKAAEVRDRAVEEHHRSAQLHDRQADLGWGNVEEHREQAQEHREDAAADSVGADRDRRAHRDDGSAQLTPPAGPDAV